CSSATDHDGQGGADATESGQIHITLLGTNDIHGGLEPRLGADGIRAGGMAFWSGAVSAMRRGLTKEHGYASRVVLLHAGDQAQGTPISNFNEGELICKVLSQIGCDAIITGNRDYDFGPKGWLVDQVSDASPDKDPRGALAQALASFKAPVVSANTYLAG